MTDTYVPVGALAAAREVLAAQCSEVSAKQEQYWPAAIWRAAIRAAGDSNAELGNLDRAGAASADRGRAHIGVRPVQNIEE